MPKTVTIKPKVDNTVTLKLNGEVFTADGLALAGQLNAVIAYWNTVLGRNKLPESGRKLKGITGPICCPPVRAMNKSGSGPRKKR
jgi:hypothetical protein